MRIPSEKQPMCVLDYYRSLNDPWQAPPACIPTWPMRPSMKAQSFARGTFQTNASGSGFILVNPFAMVCTSDGSATSPTLAILVNDPAVAVGSWDLNTGTNIAYPTGAIGQPHVSPFVQPGIANFGLYRLVSAGIRIRYIDQLAQRSGRSASYRVDGDANAGWVSDGGGTLSFSSVSNVRTSNYGTIDAEWITILYEPQTRESLDYHDMRTVPRGFLWTATSPSNNLYFAESAANLAIVLSATAPSKAFEYEITANFEIVGGLAIAPTASDVTGSEDFSFASKMVNLQRNRSTAASPSAAVEIWNSVRPTVIDYGSRFAGFAVQLGITKAASAIAAKYASPALTTLMM